MSAHDLPSLEEMARRFERQGWQLVPCRWSRRDRANVPLPGLTGGVPIRSAREVIDAAGDGVLTDDPGPRDRGLLLPAIRPSYGVVAFDVDHYGDKTGLDTIMAMEQKAGPLSPTWTLSARGPDDPSGRRWYRVPIGLVITDAVFAAFGGSVEVIRAGHRFSWCPPARHRRTGTDVLWYDPRGEVVGVPPSRDLPHLSDPWVELVEEFAERGIRDEVDVSAVDGDPEPLTASHMGAIVDRSRRRLADLRPVGGGFRNAVFDLARVGALQVRAQGGDHDTAADRAADLFGRAHPGLVPDADDRQWMAEGVSKAFRVPGWVEVDERVARADPDNDPFRTAVDTEKDRERVRRTARRELDAEGRPARPRFADLVLSDGDLESLPLPRMAIPRLLPDNAVGWLGGPSGAYKSFVAVSLALALGYGVAALADDRFVPRERRRTLYVAGEDHLGVALRIRAARHRAGITESGEVLLYPRPVDLTDPEQVDEMGAYATEHGAGHVIVDTFRTSTPGVEEISNTDVGVVLARVARLRDEHGIGSTLVDHTNKSARGLADLGGAGIKRANADYVLMIDLPNGERGADQQRTLRIAKRKGGPDGATWPVRLEPVPAVRDEDGQVSAVAVVGQCDASTVDIHGDDDWQALTLPPDVAEYRGEGSSAMGVVARLVMHHGAGESGVSRAEVLDRYREHRPDTDRRQAWTRVRKAWDALHELGRLEAIGRAEPTGRHRWVVEVSG